MKYMDVPSMGFILVMVVVNSYDCYHYPFSRHNHSLPNVIQTNKIDTIQNSMPSRRYRLLSPQRDKTISIYRENSIPSSNMHNTLSTVKEHSEFTNRLSLSNRINFEKHLESSTRRYCTCGDALLQIRFCRQDFVILARTLNVIGRKVFRVYSGGYDLSGLYSGIVYSVLIHKSVKGSMHDGMVENLFYAEGGSCGLQPSMHLMQGHEYLIGGFQVSLPHCLSSEAACQNSDRVFIVTRCGWTERLQEISMTQIAGLFLGLYSCRTDACQVQPNYKPHFFLNNSSQSSICNYDLRATSCYARFTICVPVKVQQTNHHNESDTLSTVCKLRAINGLRLSWKNRLRIPNILHNKLTSTRLLKITDEDRFVTCISQLTSATFKHV